MIGVNKRTRTTNLLYALDIEPVEMKIRKIKMNFAKRLLENKYTKRLVQSIENKQLNDNKFSNKYINEVKQVLKTQDKLEIEKIKTAINEIDEEKKNLAKNGVSDSIRTCFKMINENYHNGKNLLNLLIKAF